MIDKTLQDHIRSMGIVCPFVVLRATNPAGDNDHSSFHSANFDLLDEDTVFLIGLNAFAKRWAAKSQTYVIITIAFVIPFAILPNLYKCVQMALLSIVVGTAVAAVKVWWVRSKHSWRLPNHTVWECGLRQIDMPPPAYDEFDLL